MSFSSRKRSKVPEILIIMFFALFSLSVSEAKELYFNEQILDHTNPSSTTFKQRYFEITDYYKPDDGIVILKIGAESDSLSPSGVNDWIKDLAIHFNAIVITIEHRYFGKSKPFNDTSVEHLKYLTVDQAIEDYKVFHDKYSPDPSIKFNKTAPWLLIGGSYPGLLSAYIRAKYPKEFKAAISSAGVVYAIRDYQDFDLQDAISMGHECAAVARHTRIQIDKLLKTDKEFVMRLFNCSDKFIDEDNHQFQYFIGELYTLALQYGNLTQLCGPLVDAYRAGNDVVYALSKYAKGFFAETQGYPDSYADYYLKDESNPNSGTRSWYWMTCNDVAFWQTSPGRLGLRSPALTAKYFDDQCEKIFGAGHIPDVDKFNKEHEYFKNATNVIYTTDSQDPWTWACVTEEQASDFPADTYIHTIFGPEASHHYEFNARQYGDSKDLVRSREEMTRILEKWLKTDE